MAKRRKRRMRLKKGPVVVLIIILLLVFGFVYITHTSKYLFVKGVNKTYQNIMDDYDAFVANYFPYTNDDYHSEIDSTIAMSIGELEENFKIKGDAYLTDESNYFDIDLGINDDNYDLSMLTKDDNLYFSLDKSKYYKTDTVSRTNDYFPELIKLVIDAIKDNVKYSSFSKDTVKIKVDDKSYKTKKITLNITEEAYDKTILSIYDKLKSNDDLLGLYASLSGSKNKTDAIEKIDSQIDILKDKKSSSKVICKWSIYMYKSNPIMNELQLDSDITYKLSYINYKDYIEIDYAENDKQSSYIKLNGKDIDIFIEGILYGEGTYGNDFFRITLTDYDKKPIANISYSYNKPKFKFVLDTSLSSLKLDVSYEGKIDEEKMPNVDVSNSTPIDKLSISDMAKLAQMLGSLSDIFPL